MASGEGINPSGGNLPKWKTIGRSKNLTDSENNGHALGGQNSAVVDATSVVEQENAQTTISVKEPTSPHLFAYPEGKCESLVFSLEDELALGSKLGDIVEKLSEESIATHGSFTVVLSGGSLVKALAPLIERNIAWDKWFVFWADERVVPLNHDDSNYKAANEVFLSKVPIPSRNIVAIEEGLDVSAAASNYASKLQHLVSNGILEVTSGSVYPRFDLVLLGIGPDGHVASLFPNSPTLGVKEKWVLPVTNSPKPPPERITLTLPVLNSAKDVVFVAAGKGKAFVVERVLERAALPGSLPAQLVRPYKGGVTWLLDSAAASGLSVGKWTESKSFPFIDFR